MQRSDIVLRVKNLASVVHGTRRLGFEFKRTSAPTLSPSMHAALDTLGLDSLTVVHAGRDSFPMARGARAVAAKDLLEQLKPLR